MARRRIGVLFTPVTQRHVGRPTRSLSLFTETSYSSRLGGLCPDHSSIFDPVTDLKHRTPMLGNERGPDAPAGELVSLRTLASETLMLEIDVGPR